MATIVQSCRLPKSAATLLARQAKRRLLDASTLATLYITEKAREEEFPGIGFRDHIGGREAYIVGHRVAVWEVLDNYKEVRSIAKTADYYNWPEHLVKCALDYAKAFPDDIAAQRAAEVSE